MAPPGLIAAVLVLLLTACAADRKVVGPGPSGEPATILPAPTPADPPMPPGRWETVYAGRQEMSRGWSERAVMVSRAADVIDRAVLVYRIHLGKRWEFLPRDACRDPGYWYETGDDAGAESGACWHVRAVNLGTAGQPHWVNVVLAGHAESNDLFLPAVMIGVRYIRYHADNLLQVDYLWNPDLLLPPPAGRVWRPDDWRNAAIADDPSKQAIMRTLRRWAEEWQPRIAAALPVPAN
jgi:hypothetical protein